jgi:hypothetical protein
MAVRFDADGEDYTRTTNLPSATTFTLCLWLIIDTDRNTFSCPISLDAGTGNYVYFETDADGTTLKLWEGDDAVTPSGPNVVLTVGTWYFIALVRNGTGANSGTVYSAAAGVAALTSGQRTLDTSFTPNTLRIGESPFGGEWWNGRVAAVKIWDAALSQAEIENERWQYSPHRIANLNAFYPFLTGGANAAAQADFSGNGNNLSNGTNSATADGPPIPWKQQARQIFIAPAAAGGATINADARISALSRMLGQSAVNRTSSARIGSVSRQSAGTAVIRVSSARMHMRVAARATSAVSRISAAISAARSGLRAAGDIVGTVFADARMTFRSSVSGVALVARSASARISFQSLFRGLPLVARVGAARLLARTGLIARHFQDAAPIAIKVSVGPVTWAKVASAPVTDAKVADAPVTRAKITVSLGG